MGCASKGAGIADLHFHDLRGTAITMLAEAGFTIPDIGSITSHARSVETILEKYLARTRSLAESAIAQLENAFGTEPARRKEGRDAK